MSAERHAHRLERYRMGQHPLSHEQLTVALYILTGLTNKEIAGEVMRTESSVKYHITNIYAKAKVLTRAQFIAAWFEANLPAPILKQLPKSPHTFRAMAALNACEPLPRGAA